MGTRVALHELPQHQPQLRGTRRVAMGARRLDRLRDHLLDAPLALRGAAKMAAKLEGNDLGHVVSGGDDRDLLRCQLDEPKRLPGVLRTSQAPDMNYPYSLFIL
jgi:hypothetical protein